MPRLCPPGKLHRALDTCEDDLEEGLAQVRSLVRKYPKDPDVRSALGSALLDADVPSEALPHLEWAEGKDPRPALQQALMETYLALTMPLHAMRLAKRAGAGVEDPEIEQAELTRQHGDVPESVPTRAQLELEQARIALMRGERGAARTLQRLVEAHPDYLSARNLWVTALISEGEFGRFLEAAREGAERAPHDVHAMLNAVRAALLQEGVEAARAYRDRVASAGSYRSPVDAQWARAYAFALMDEDTALADAIMQYFELTSYAGERAQDTVMDDLVDALEQRSLDRDTPLVRLEDLLAGAIDRWETLGEKRMAREAGRDLAQVPGLLGLLPGWIGYEQPRVARLLAVALLSDHAPPSPEAPWAEVLIRVAQEGPGIRKTRVALLLYLGAAGVIDVGDAYLAGEDTNDLRIHSLEVTGEPTPSGLSDADDARLTEALQDLTSGRIGEARPVLAELAAQNPHSATVAFNLAVSETLGNPEDPQRGRDRMERLTEEHPHYLFPRAHLGVEALKEGNIARAEELLQIPEGLERVHVQEWVTFTAALGRLALAHGDMELANDHLDSIGEAMGKDQPAYRMLSDAIEEEEYAGLAAEEAEGDEEVAWGDLDGLLDGDGDGAADPDDDFEDDLLDDFEDEPPPPDPAEVAALPVLDEGWFFAVAPAAFMIGEEEPEAVTQWLAAVVSDAGDARAVRPHPEPLDTDAAYAVVARACAGTDSEAEPGRPRHLTVASKRRAVQLRRALKGTDIPVEEGDASPARELLEQMTEALGSGVPAWLANEDENDALDFLEATDDFYDAIPWERFPPDGYLAFRVGEGPWRYASIMGHLGDEFGMAMFEGWDHLQAFTEGGPTESQEEASARLKATGDFEGLSLSPLGSLSPLDAARYLELDVGPDVDGEVATLHRFTPERMARPRHGAAVYAALLRVVADRAGRKGPRARAFDTTCDTPEGTLRVLYPARGDEGAREASGEDVHA
ncbi:MAG: hypothetical protein U5K81_08555 [Trueperaceae bacterium]|nr:hypothetical protein [Trueperaceae bacterium]